MSPRLLLGVMVVFAAAVSTATHPFTGQSLERDRHIENVSAYDCATRSAADVVPVLVTLIERLEF